jgi:hypothetical protein
LITCSKIATARVIPLPQSTQEFAANKYTLLLLGPTPPTTPRHCLFGTSLRPSVGFCALPMDRQIAPVTQTAIAADFHQTLDVHLHFSAEITFNPNISLDYLAQRRDLSFIEISDLLIGINGGLL